MSSSPEPGLAGQLETDPDVHRTTEWDQVTRRYRRGLGGWWWLALLLVPLLLALLGLAFNGDSSTGDAKASPFSIGRSASGISVKAEVPDEAAKTALLDKVRAASPGVTVDDQVTVTAGANGPDLGGLGSLLGAGAALPEFGLDFDGTTLALTGHAVDESAKAAVGDAAKAAFPSWQLDNQVTVVTPLPSPSASAGAAALEIKRSGNSIAVTGVVPDDAAKLALVDAVKAASPGATVDDQVTVTAGAAAPDLAALGGGLAALTAVPDFGLGLDGTTLTLTGEAPTEDAKAKAEAAVKTAYPAATVVNQLTVKAAPTTPTAAAGCATLEATIKGIIAKQRITFTPGSDDLTSSSVRTVRAIAAKATACPDLKLTVAGHTDITAIGDGKALSLSRANAVKTALVRAGVAAGNIRAVGYGETKPIASNRTATGMAKNRRVEITVD